MTITKLYYLKKGRKEQKDSGSLSAGSGRDMQEKGRVTPTASPKKGFAQVKSQISGPPIKERILTT